MAHERATNRPETAAWMGGNLRLASGEVKFLIGNKASEPLSGGRMRRPAGRPAGRALARSLAARQGGHF